MKVTFLGTSGAFPTECRNATSHVVWVQGETLLLDCGEGTQQQLRRSSHVFGVDRIFLSHLHLDHVLGLPGYLWTMDLLNRTAPLHVYAPPGTEGWLRSFIGGVEKLRYPLHLREVDDGTVIHGQGYSVQVARVIHHGGVCLGFRVQEPDRPGKVNMEKARALGLAPGKQIGALVRGQPVALNGRLIQPEEVVGKPRRGRSVAYSGDTRPCPAMITLASGADLLIHEAMFAQVLAQEATARGHSTAQEAAEVARQAGVKRLALTHVSQRFQDADGLSLLLAEAGSLFPEVFLPADLDQCMLSLDEAPETD